MTRATPARAHSSSSSEVPPPTPQAAYDLAVADDGHCALAQDHVPPFGGNDAPVDGRVGPFLEVAAGPACGGRGHGFALGAVHAGPACAVHSGKGLEPSSAVANGYVDLDAERFCLGNGAFYNTIGFSER